MKDGVRPLSVAELIEKMARLEGVVAATEVVVEDPALRDPWSLLDVRVEDGRLVLICW